MSKCLSHSKEMPCPQCEENEARGYEVRQLAGRCADGFEGGHGVRWHALKNGDALCKAKPGRRSAGWSEYQVLGQVPTCPKCLRKLANENKA